MSANRRRLAAVAALALGTAFALALRSAAERWRREQLAVPFPVPVPPPAPPVVPPVVLPPVAPILAPAPPAPAKPKRGKGWWWFGIAAAAVVLASAALGASHRFHPGFGAQIATSTPTTTPTTTTTTGPATTSPTTTAATTGTTGTTGTNPAVAPATLCVKPPSGWKSEWVPRNHSTPPALVLTNFRFGSSVYEWGLVDPDLRWPTGATLIAVADWTKLGSPGYLRSFLPGALHVRPADISRFGAFPVKIGHRLVRLDGRYLEFWVETRPPTSASFAAANSVLSRVHTLAACQ